MPSDPVRGRTYVSRAIRTQVSHSWQAGVWACRGVRHTALDMRPGICSICVERATGRSSSSQARIARWSKNWVFWTLGWSGTPLDALTSTPVKDRTASWWDLQEKPLPLALSLQYPPLRKLNMVLTVKEKELKGIPTITAEQVSKGTLIAQAKLILKVLN